jgi:hypothetical protein
MLWLPRDGWGGLDRTVAAGQHAAVGVGDRSDHERGGGNAGVLGRADGSRDRGRGEFRHRLPTPGDHNDFWRDDNDHNDDDHPSDYDHYGASHDHYGASHDHNDDDHHDCIYDHYERIHDHYDRSRDHHYNHPFDHFVGFSGCGVGRNDPGGYNGSLTWGW